MRTRFAASLVLGVGLFGGAFLGCSAGTNDTGGTGTGNGGPGGNGTGGTGQGAGAPTTSQGGSTGQFTTGIGGGGGEGGGVIINPCGTGCGPVELCTGINQGLDDNCDGTVDEGCPCGAGQASSCFKGDPSFIDSPLCEPGTMSCTELSVWGPCFGGKHADATDQCQLGDALGCHPINGVPFQTTDLRSGAGTFDDNADTDSFTVACPPGVSPCPAPSGSNYQALQSGEYTVTYTKTVGGVTSSCTFPLFIGARGLRVELSWNFPQGTDQDLHLHEPMTATPWDFSGFGDNQDCGWGNCQADDFLPPFPSSTAPSWFPPGNMPPAPVNWYDAPTDAEDLCYFAPRGEGDAWKAGNKGCHSPRLDLDNISCNASVTDPQNSSFCAPENINIDYPPKDQWMRIAVHYYSGSALITPQIRVYCDGKLAGDLGAKGFNSPESPVSYNVSDKVWLVADVIFKEDQCSKLCVVEPLYLNDDTTAKTPVIVTEAQASATFGPPYKPIP